MLCTILTEVVHHHHFHLCRHHHRHDACACLCAGPVHIKIDYGERRERRRLNGNLQRARVRVHFVSCLSDYLGTKVGRNQQLTCSADSVPVLQGCSCLTDTKTPAPTHSSSSAAVASSSSSAPLAELNNEIVHLLMLFTPCEKKKKIGESEYDRLVLF